MGEDRRMAAFEAAYRDFVTCVGQLTAEQFASQMENGTPRDLVARLIGWNRLTVLGAKSIQEAKPPPYHLDFANDYRKVNAELISRQPASDRAVLLRELEATKAEGVEFLRGVSVELWNADLGVRHPDGGPATVRRCLEELTRDYLNATDEITIWLETAAPK
jgi:hypothetical protein